MAVYDENVTGGAYGRSSGYSQPGEDDEVGVEAARSPRYNTYRARGFSSGVRDTETGNVIHGGTSALRNITANNQDYDEQQKAEAAAEQAQADADAYALSLTETPYGPADGTHENTLGMEVANDWDSRDYQQNLAEGLNPFYSAHYGIREHGVQGYLSPKNYFNPARQAVAAGEQVLGRVICTELYSRKLIPLDIYRADMAYTKRLPDAVVRGYHLLAIPYVRLMRKYSWAVKLVHKPAVWRAEELAYQLGRHSKPNWKGKMVRLIGEPICFVFGLFIKDQDYSVLYQGEKS